MGRPSAYTQELSDEIIRDLSLGVTLADICRRDHMPDRTTVYDWLKVRDEFSQRYARARDEGFDAIAEQCLAIADDSSLDTKIVGEDEREVCNTEFVQRSKLRIWTRLELLKRWDPKRYGDLIRQEHTGPNGGPIETRGDLSTLASLNRDQRMVLRQALQGALSGQSER